MTPERRKEKAQMYREITADFYIKSLLRKQGFKEDELTELAIEIKRCQILKQRLEAKIYYTLHN